MADFEFAINNHIFNEEITPVVAAWMDIIKEDYAYKPVRPSNVVDIFSYRANMAK